MSRVAADIATVTQAAGKAGLAVVGAFHALPGDDAPEGVGTLCLLGGTGPEMWRAFQASDEAGDGQADPMDRWSRRVIGRLAAELGGVALFPFGGPPYQPFQRWAVRGEGAVTSPVAMQVTAARGLWTSYRGALGFEGQLVLRDNVAGASPCIGCPAPCLSACPVDAFADGVYDVPRCVAHVTSPLGADCRAGGCLVRRVCPAGQETAPSPEQCSFHMEAFIRARLAAAEPLTE